MGDSFKTLTASAIVADEDIDGEDEADGEEPCDSEAWETLSKIFREVQSLLDHNRVLIQQANENHRSRIPHNLANNVNLIREINGNISKVVGLYSDLSANFSGVFRRRRHPVSGEGC